MPKLDYAIFSEYVRKQLEKEATNENEMRAEERIFKIEQRAQASLLRSEFEHVMADQVTGEKVEEIELVIDRISQQLLISKDDHERALKRLDAEMAKKTSDLNSFVLDLTGRLKVVEDDLATDKEDGGDVAKSKESLDLVRKSATALAALTAAISSHGTSPWCTPWPTTDPL